MRDTGVRTTSLRSTPEPSRPPPVRVDVPCGGHVGPRGTSPVGLGNGGSVGGSLRSVRDRWVGRVSGARPHRTRGPHPWSDPTSSRGLPSSRDSLFRPSDRGWRTEPLFPGGSRGVSVVPDVLRGPALRCLRRGHLFDGARGRPCPPHGCRGSGARDLRPHPSPLFCMCPFYCRAPRGPPRSASERSGGDVSSFSCMSVEKVVRSGPDGVVDPVTRVGGPGKGLPTLKSGQGGCREVHEPHRPGGTPGVNPGGGTTSREGDGGRRGVGVGAGSDSRRERDPLRGHWNPTTAGRQTHVQCSGTYSVVVTGGGPHPTEGDPRGDGVGTGHPPAALVSPGARGTRPRPVDLVRGSDGL